MNRDIHSIDPPLLADGGSLDAYLRNYPNVYSAEGYPAIGLDSWKSLGDDAGEATYLTARRLGLPLVRLDQIRSESDATRR